MSEPFDRAMLGLDPGAPPLDDAGQTVAQMVAATRQVFNGMDDLPVTGIPLDDDPNPQAVADAAVDTEPPGVPLPLPLDPGPPPTSEPTGSIPGPETELLRSELQLLRDEIATLRQSGTQTAQQTADAAQARLDRLAGRFEATFSGLDSMDPTETEFQVSRARGFADTIERAVKEDILDDEFLRQRITPIVREVATAISRDVVDTRQATQTHESARATMISDAVRAARTAGYDVYLPEDPRHATSSDSRLFWGAATQVNGNLPVAQQISDTLSLLPARTPAPPPADPTPTPRPVVPPPMGRQANMAGAVPAATSPTPGGEGAPKSTGQMMRELRQAQRMA